MKNIIVILCLFFSHLIFSQEISLFNSNGDAIAYIDTDDEDNTIYLWNGTPVAYLSPESDYYNIYGFNGNHLGWFEEGIVRNHDGDAVGFQDGAVNMYTKYEPYKSYKKFKPFKSFEEYLRDLNIDSKIKIEDHFNKWLTKEKIKIKDIGKNLRLCLTGSGSSIDLIRILDILGIEEIISRLSYNVDRS